MRKIKELEVKKAWAKIARKAQFELRSPEYGLWANAIPCRTCGIWSGCCSALGSYPVKLAFGEFFKKSGQSNMFWWPVPHSDTPKTRRAYTARIIALESFAVYCEEHGV